MKGVLQLYPNSGSETLEGLYLRNPLVAPTWGDRIFVYSNFVVSLDGRIASVNPKSGCKEVPKSIANPRDWRLFQELAAQCDIVLTNGSYLRCLKNPNAPTVLPLSADPAFDDLHRWRITHGLKRQPDVAILSASLDFDLPPSLLAQHRNIHVFTSTAEQTRMDALRQRGANIIVQPRESIASGMVRWLDQRGYRRLYSVAGPRVLNSLLRDDVLDALFLTTVHRFIGGEAALTLHHGPLPEPADFVLRSLYLDRATDPQQTLARYDRRR